MVKCIVRTIIEPDFGCEGIPEGADRVDTVILEESISGTLHHICIEDSMLYQLDINEGDEVEYSPDKTIQKYKGD